MPSLARSVPKPLKVSILAPSVPEPLKVPSFARSVPKPLLNFALARRAPDASLPSLSTPYQLVIIGALSIKISFKCGQRINEIKETLSLKRGGK